jgi:hypothetical protein
MCDDLTLRASAAGCIEFLLRFDLSPTRLVESSPSSALDVVIG